MSTLIFIGLIMLSNCEIFLVESGENWLHRTRFIRDFSHLYSNKFLVLIKPHNQTDGRLRSLIHIRNVFTRSLQLYTTIHDFSTFYSRFSDSDGNYGMTTVYTHLDSVNVEELNAMLRGRHGLWTWLCEMRPEEDGESRSRLRDVHPPMNGKFFVVKWKSEDLAVIEEMYEMPRSERKELRYFGEWREEGGLRVEEKDVAKRREDLKGVSLRYFTYNNGSDSVCKGDVFYKHYGLFFDCYNMKLWEEFGKAFNFTTKYMNYETSDFLPLMLEKFGSGECDSGQLVLIMSNLNASQVQFLWPIASSSYKIMTSCSGAEIHLASFLKPCSTSFWIVLAVWLTAAGIFLALLVSLADSAIRQKNRSSSDHFRNFYIPFQAICLQGCNLETSSAGIRIALLVCYLTPVVLVTSYSGVIISSLAKPQGIPFRNLKEFEENGEYRLAALKNTFAVSFLKSDPMFEESRTKSLILEDFPVHSKEAFEDMCNRKIALVAELRSLVVKPPDCCAYFLQEKVGNYLNSMVVSSQFPFAESLKRYVQKMSSVGISIKQYQKMAITDFNIELNPGLLKGTDENADKSVEPASLDSLIMLFVVLFSGIAFAAAVLTVEIWMKAREESRSEASALTRSPAELRRLAPRRMQPLWERKGSQTEETEAPFGVERSRGARRGPAA